MATQILNRDYILLPKRERPEKFDTVSYRAITDREMLA